MTKPGCPYCDAAKVLLTDLGLAYAEEVKATPEEIAEFKALGHKTFPQVYDGETHIGGHDDLVEYLA